MYFLIVVSFESLCKLPKFRTIETLPEEIKQSALKYSLKKLKVEQQPTNKKHLILLTFMILS
jgi:hypothetical protein